jgi:hypothetical protein
MLMLMLMVYIIQVYTTHTHATEHVLTTLKHYSGHRGIAPGIFPVNALILLVGFGLAGGAGLCSPLYRIPTGLPSLRNGSCSVSLAPAFLTPALISASRNRAPSASNCSSSVCADRGGAIRDAGPGVASSSRMMASSGPSTSMPSSSSAAASASCVAPPRVLCFRGQREGRTICWKRGSTARSSNQAWTRDSMSCAILGTSWRREREPTRERTERSRR